jgi:uncharacterized protein
MAAVAPPPPANPNLAALERAYARWAESRGGNVDEVLALMDDDIVMESIMPAEVPHALSGTHSRKQQARSYFVALLAEWEMVDWQVDRFIADGDDIVMVGRCHWRHRTGGQEVRSPKVDIWHFDDGRATHFYEMFDTLAFARGAGLV